MVQGHFGGLRVAPNITRPVQRCRRGSLSFFGHFGDFSMHLLFSQPPRSLLASQLRSPPQAGSCHAAAHHQANWDQSESHWLYWELSHSPVSPLPGLQGGRVLSIAEGNEN